MHFQNPLEAIVVGAVLLFYPGKDELVIGKVHPITRLHSQILLDAVVLGAGDTYDADCQPHMAKDHGPVAVAKLAHTDRKAVLVGRSRPSLLHAGDDDPGPQTNPYCRPRLEGFGKEQRQQQGCGQTQHQCHNHLAFEFPQLLTTPAKQRANPQQQGKRDDQPAVDVVEEGSTDGNAPQPQLLVHQRQQGTEQHGQQTRHQHDVVAKQQGLAAPQLVFAVALHLRAFKGKQQQGGADHRQQEAENKQTAGRIRGKRMHRDQHAGAHQEGTQQAQREG